MAGFGPTIGSLLDSARPGAGAALYGVYGAARGLAAWGVLLGPEWARWLLAHKPTARRVAAGQLVLLGVATAVAVGW